MLFDNVIEQIQASKKEEAEVVIVKLGEVTSVTPGGRAYVKLYGDGNPSTKLYTYIDGYFPEQGDKVALLPQGKTYIILGKVNDENPVEIYAKIKWVEEKFCPIEYKSILEDASHQSEQITFDNYSLLPTTDNKDILGAATKYFKEIFIKKLTLDGESFTKIYQDRIFVKDGNNIYSLIATYSGGIVTLTPSADNMWALGTSSAKLKEIWTYLFRGTWKSGNATERALSWDSNNALVPDSSGAIDLGTASALFKNLFLTALIGAKWQYNTNAAYNLAWSDASNLLPSDNKTVNLGSSTKMFANIYAEKFYLNGTEMSTITAALTVTSGSNTRTLTLTYTSAGADLLPNLNDTFKIGSATKKFAEIFATKFTGDLTGNVTGNVTGRFRESDNFYIAFDSSHNINPSSSGNISLGTSSLKYKDIYATDFHGNLTGDVSGSLKDGSTYTIGFDSAHNWCPSNNNAINLGKSGNQFNKAYVKELYIDGTQFDPSGVVAVAKLSATYGSGSSQVTREFTLTATSSGATLLPSSNNNFKLGDTSNKFSEVVASYFTGTLDGNIRVGNGTLSIDHSNVGVYPSSDDTMTLGASSYQFKAGYFKKLYLDGTEVDLSNFSTDKLTATSGSYTRTITLSAQSNNAAQLLPATNDTYDIGKYGTAFNEVFASFLVGGLRNYTSSSSYQSIVWDNLHNFYPSTTNTVSLGTANKQFKNIYGQNIYVNGTAVSSDRRKKEDISPLDGRYDEFFKSLNPISFKYKDGTSGRKHTGFIAQEVEEAAEKAGLNDKDLAVVVKDPEGNYYLRYEEIIAIQTKIIKELMADVEALKTKNRTLEARLEKIEKFLFEN